MNNIAAGALLNGLQAAFWGGKRDHLKPQVQPELIVTAKRLLLPIGLLVDQCLRFSKRWKEGGGDEVSSKKCMHEEK